MGFKRETRLSVLSSQHERVRILSQLRLRSMTAGTWCLQVYFWCHTHKSMGRFITSQSHAQFMYSDDNDYTGNE
eukprot:1924804-Pleurochrysis_carterae.AAC.1